MPEDAADPSRTPSVDATAVEGAHRAGSDTPRGRLPLPGAAVPRWRAAYPPAVPASYDYPRVPLTRLLDDAAQDFPQATALDHRGYELTYRELHDRVDRFAAALDRLGVRRGDRVGLLLPTCPQHVVAIFAALRLGAVVVEHGDQRPAADVEAQVRDAGCRVLVCLDPVYGVLRGLRERLESVEHIISTAMADALPFPRNLLQPLTRRRDGSARRFAAGEGVLRYADLVHRSPPTAVQADGDPAADAAVVFYTKRSPRRGVVLTHLNLVANAFQARLWIPDVQAGREHLLCVLPFSHPGGFTLGLSLGVLSAATLSLVPRFDEGATAKLVERRRPTLLPAAAPLLTALAAAAAGKHDLSSLRVVLAMGQPLPTGDARRLEELTGAKVRQIYGLAEAGPLTHANPVYGKAKPGRVGLPVTDTASLLVDLDDPTRPADPGGPGELVIAGPQVMQGYWNDPDATARVLAGGWLHTGDVAEVDDDGYVAILGRKRDRNAHGYDPPA